MKENKKFAYDLMVALYCNGIGKELNVDPCTLSCFIINCLGEFDIANKRKLTETNDLAETSDSLLDSVHINIFY